MAHATPSPQPAPPPLRRLAPGLAADLEDLAAEVAGAARTFEHRLDHDEEDARPPAQVQAEVALARRLREAIAGRPEQMEAIDAYFGVWCEGWLEELVFGLQRRGRADEALALCDEFAEGGRAVAFLEIRAMVLCRAGRRDEAVAQVDANLARFPGNADVMDQAAEVLELCGEVARAEALCREVLAARPGDPALRAASLERLARILREQGRLREALAEEARLGAALRQARQAHEAEMAEHLFPDLLDELDQGGDGSARGPGRNQPCPCGSGKKYKRCCGA